ncbi:MULTISPECIES: DUF3581 domain-containing protein [Shewanella]|uniref:DUF3581 domain-containing protein n=2 Tax=Shewanella TaxID=22 RepID=A0A1N6VVD8_9GAMM|nr:MULTISPECIES: DUF3581 domain-containing protein [Shewanella]MCL1087518.1 DUF3581 domain-containing protein [Shewanella glacialipiscicola]PTA51385.1 DUF3581 domain-containing protein [Shewanella morhuae]SIQ81616.1 Protein of unknown function [Shewanella morhuae]SUI81842.1 Protein of uncharacterised function (DUF3581) [Shewanella morhuae]GIU09595.1 hypothetical protein TUM4636_15850 [Shewanella glacialipiscicola]
MFLAPYFLKQNQTISVSAQQASDFAKKIAQDFNPIHDVGAKRFCVPGDLLFALVLTQYGLSQQMKFSFAGMVGDGTELQFPAQVNDSFSICDSREKVYLNVSRQGDVSRCDAQTESFIRQYVAFSGHNFIDILIPLMKQHQVMINPERPLVIYESMSFDLTTLDFIEVTLSLVGQDLKINGKRGDVTLHFELHSGDIVVGTGIKTLVMSGLRPYEEASVQQMRATYEGRKTDF